MADEAEVNSTASTDVPPPKKRGRPKGSLNKKTIARLAAAAESADGKDAEEAAQSAQLVGEELPEEAAVPEDKLPEPEKLSTTAVPEDKLPEPEAAAAAPSAQPEEPVPEPRQKKPRAVRPKRPRVENSRLPRDVEDEPEPRMTYAQALMKFIDDTQRIRHSEKQARYDAFFARR